MEELTTLVERARRGDHQAYAMLVQRFQDMAVGYCYAKVGDLTVAEDLAQEAFLKAYYSLGDLREPAAFPGWFQRILLTQVGRFQQKRQLPTIPLDLVDGALISDETPLQIVEQRERTEQVQRAIAALPPAQAEVITLYYIGDYSQQEISAFLGVPLSTVKMRLYHARQTLAERMVDMVHATLQEQRPSNDQQFIDKVMSFLQAIRAGDLSQIQTMLHADPRLLTTKSVLDPAGRKREPLAHALIYGHKEIATFLLAQGADINAQADNGLSVLHLALGAQQNELARWLVAQGAEVDVWAAALLGDLPLVQAFVEADPTLVHARWVVGATLLHMAATVPLAQYLLGQGADPQVRTGQMALTPLGWHASMNHRELVQFYITQGCKAENIFVACAIGDLVQVQALLAADPALLHTRDLERNHSQLHYAALGGHCAVAQFLLDQGMDVNDGVAEGVLTPLHVAIQCNQAAMVQFLIQAGADLMCKDSYDQLTVRQWAERYGNETIIHLVQEADK